MSNVFNYFRDAVGIKHIQEVFAEQKHLDAMKGSQFNYDFTHLPPKEAKQAVCYKEYLYQRFLDNLRSN